MSLPFVKGPNWVYSRRAQTTDEAGNFW